MAPEYVLMVPPRPLRRTALILSRAGDGRVQRWCQYAGLAFWREVEIEQVKAFLYIGTGLSIRNYGIDNLLPCIKEQRLVWVACEVMVFKRWDSLGNVVAFAVAGANLLIF